MTDLLLGRHVLATAVEVKLDANGGESHGNSLVHSEGASASRHGEESSGSAERRRSSHREALGAPEVKVAFCCDGTRSEGDGHGRGYRFEGDWRGRSSAPSGGKQEVSEPSVRPRERAGLTSCTRYERFQQHVTRAPTLSRGSAPCAPQPNAPACSPRPTTHS